MVYELPQSAIMTPREVRLVKSGECPHCFLDSLQDVSTGDFHARQCKCCGRVFVLDDKPGKAQKEGKQQ